MHVYHALCITSINFCIRNCQYEELIVKTIPMSSCLSPQATANLLYAVLTAQLKSTFHKINVHAAMTPADIQKYFNPVFEQANALKEAFERRAHNEQLAASSQVSKTKTSSCYFTIPLIPCPSKILVHNYSQLVYQHVHLCVPPQKSHCVVKGHH